MLTNADIRELTSFRRELHRKPELSGEEAETAKTISGALTELAPDHLLSGLGGHGVAAVYDSGRDGPTVLFRAELDALPIKEASGAEWSSETSGKAHLCGHDGHMTMLLALARLLSRRRPQTGRCVLMFQPAEEDGSGARAVVADPKFRNIRPDWAFAIHNEPALRLCRDQARADKLRLAGPCHFPQGPHEPCGRARTGLLSRCGASRNAVSAG